MHDEMGDAFFDNLLHPPRVLDVTLPRMAADEELALVEPQDAAEKLARISSRPPGKTAWRIYAPPQPDSKQWLSG